MTAIADNEIPRVTEGAQQLRIEGGAKLVGGVSIGGAKNSALPIMAAALLTDQPCLIRNVPWIDDIETLAQVLRSLGAKVQFEPDHSVLVSANNLTSTCAPADLVRKMRASFLVMGPLLARFGIAEAAQPGGCDIGIRPVNVDIDGFREMGAEVASTPDAYRVICTRLSGTEIYLDYPSHTGTENLLMAACLADGDTVIKHASTEPEVVDLAQFLSALGANIDGAGTSTIVVHGVSGLHGCEYTVMPDRLIAGTYMAAAAITGGDITVEKVIPDHLDAVIYKLQKMGVTVDIGDDCLRARAAGPMRSVDIQAIHYPGFPTDLQAVFGAVLTQADGMSTIHERVFENRLGYADQLNAMGAELEVDGQTARVHGPTPLHAANVRALDIRAGVAVILAALAADGVSTLSDAQIVSRGYEGIVEVLQGFGGNISWSASAAQS